MVILKLCPRYLSSTRTFQVIEIKTVGIWTGISKLPCIAMPALFFSVGYPPRHLTYLKIVTCPDVFYEKDQLVPAYLTESYMLV